MITTILSLVLVLLALVVVVVVVVVAVVVGLSATCPVSPGRRCRTPVKHMK